MTSTSPFQIRPVLPTEHLALGELTVHAYASGGFLHDPADGFDDPYADRLRDVDSRAAASDVLVAVDDGTVIGGVTVARHGSPLAELSGPGEAEIRMLAVDPAAHGRGVGSALAATCLDYARAGGDVTRVVLCSQVSMRSAHRIYERLGFVRDRRLDWEPAPGIVLWGFALDL